MTFELKESDLEHFRDVMRKARDGAEKLSEQEILANARKLSQSITVEIPPFVSERLKKLETLVAMIEDDEWQIPEEAKTDVLSALAYFSDPEDLVPDHIPVLGFLDDAIMIELVVTELKEDISAFIDFCAYREREESRRDTNVTRDEWLDAKRRELHSRMRNRRRGLHRGGSSFRSIF